MCVDAFGDLEHIFPPLRALTISRTTVSGNSASNRGGGVWARAHSGTEILIEDSRVTGNHVTVDGGGAKKNGGGIYAYVQHDNQNNDPEGLQIPRFTISRTTVDDNEAPNMGGGVFVCSKYNGNFIAINSTLSSNRTLNETIGAGGGIFIAHVVEEIVHAYLRNMTITQNWSASGGGVGTLDAANTFVQIANSIISQNFLNNGTTKNNLVGRVEVGDFKHNLIGTGSTVKNSGGTIVLRDSPLVNTIPGANNNLLFNDAPGLSALGDHGGPTPTHRLLAGSPAIDAGSNALATMPLSGPPEAALATDQRGEKFNRIFDIPGVGNSGTGPTGFALDIGAYEVQAPRVIEVRVSKSGTPSTEYSFLGHVGSGEQLRTVPVGGADTVTVRFSEVVSNLAIGSVTLNGLTTGSTLTPASGGFTPGADMGTWRFNAAFPLDQYVLNVFDTVTAAGAALDGDWINPLRLTTTNPDVSRFPSGDGTPGGAFRFAFTILPGDANLNNLVDGNDWLIFQLNLGGPGKLFEQADWNGDGYVNSADSAIWQANFARDLSRLVLADFYADMVVNATDYGV